jgi:hypothetical protein
MTTSKCHICGKEAVDRCFTCGNLFCPEHGNTNCSRCQSGIVEGDNRQDRVSAAPRAEGMRPAWWRPQVAEDFEPPACYVCKGLARLTCFNCQRLYCAEHAGRNGLCRNCASSSWLGLIIFFGVIAALGLLIVLGYWTR